MSNLEQLTLRLASNLEALANAKTKKQANRAELMLRSTNSKIDMIVTQHVPGMQEQTVGEFYEQSLEDDPIFTDPEAAFLIEQEDVQDFVLDRIGKNLLGDVETDIIPSDMGECYVQFRTRAGEVAGSGEHWAEAMGRALAAFEEIKHRAKVDIRPIDQKTANQFIATVHRHHDPPAGDKFRLGAFSNVNGVETLVGVVIVGHPQARLLQKKEPKTLEVTRMATLAGASGLNSQLYSAAWRETQKRGYDKLVTYILADEPGTSLKASNWWIDKAKVEGGRWDRPGRRRTDHHPTEEKVRWMISKKRPAAGEHHAASS